MANRRRIALAIVFGATAATAPAQAQVDRPRVSVELNLFTGLIAAVGESLADETVDALTVEGWLPGAEVALRLSDRIELVYGLQPGYDFVLSESWGFGPQLDGDIELPHETGTVHRLVARATVVGGLYAEAGATMLGSSRYEMHFERKGETLRLGASDYATDFTAAWVSKAKISGMFGFGYTWLLSNAIRIGVGIAVPVPFGEGEVMDLVLTPREPGITIAPSDVLAAEQALDQETFYAPIVGRLSLGYSWMIGG